MRTLTVLLAVSMFTFFLFSSEAFSSEGPAAKTGIDLLELTDAFPVLGPLGTNVQAETSVEYEVAPKRIYVNPLGWKDNTSVEHEVASKRIYVGNCCGRPTR